MLFPINRISCSHCILHRESGVSMSFQLVERFNFDGDFWRRESTVPIPELIQAPHSAQPQM